VHLGRLLQSGLQATVQAPLVSAQSEANRAVFVKRLLHDLKR
jgi:hypothetical protein